MLSLLLDENISPEVADQINWKRPDIPIVSLQHWQEGILIGMSDKQTIRCAAQAELILVTYDQNSLPELLARLGSEGFSHEGVIFIDRRTLSSNDFGGLVRALVLFWDDRHDYDWENRIDYLRAAPSR
ncbi:MAG: DUF5615 family PIN-like protein [Armatimonadetes bacterium]|nr:DUF5615 family PIN-like protein [Armatimonadota bacterium]